MSSAITEATIDNSPAFTARFSPTIQHLGMLILGVQGAKNDLARPQMDALAQSMMVTTANAKDVLFRDQGIFTDAEAMHNRIVVCYFEGSRSARQAAEDLAEGWLANSRTDPHLGFYIEEIWPTMDRVETLFSSAHMQGVGHMAAERSGEIRENGYWGSARDRLPAAQVDLLHPAR